MRCHQCPRPAFYVVGQEGEQGVPLCLDCWSKLETVNYRKFLMNAAMMNQAADDMDMVTGIPLGGGRIPVAAMARAMQRSNVYNNINVNNSQVGVINTGDLAKIDAAITLSQGSDVEAIATILKSLTETIVRANEIEANSKKELIELITALSEEIVRSKKQSVIMSLLVAIEERAKGLNAVVQLAGALKVAIYGFFGVPIPT